jgi:hypothetical protein
MSYPASTLNHLSSASFEISHPEVGLTSSTSSSTHWLPDTAVLFRCLQTLDCKDASIALLFDEFCRKCCLSGSSDPDVGTQLSKKQKTLPSRKCNSAAAKVAGAGAGATSGVEGGASSSSSSDEADEEMKQLQCRFLLSLNDLQRLGCARLMASGDTVKRLLV